MAREVPGMMCPLRVSPIFIKICYPSLFLPPPESFRADGTDFARNR